MAMVSHTFIGKRNRHDDRPCAKVLNKSITSDGAGEAVFEAVLRAWHVVLPRTGAIAAALQLYSEIWRLQN